MRMFYFNGIFTFLFIFFIFRYLFLRFDKQMNQFNTLIPRILQNEGGYVCNNLDSGGETKYGISKRSYPNLNIKELTQDDAISIYYSDFYLKLNISDLDDEMAYQIFDHAVNAGISQAKKLMKYKTLNEVKAARRTFYESLANFPIFGNSWLNRIYIYG